MCNQNCNQGRKCSCTNGQVIYKSGMKLVDRQSGDVFVISASNAEETHYQGASGRGFADTSEITAIFEVSTSICGALNND